MFVEALGEALGPEGTIAVPTYTYSFGKNECFEVESTPSAVGPFTEYFRNQPGVLRSRDPMLSVAAQGPLARQLLSDLPRTCYGPGSVYARLIDFGFKICTVGLGLHWATFRHHIEELAAVPFRYKKVFVGRIRQEEMEAMEAWVYSVRILAENGIPDGRRLAALAEENHLCRQASLGRGQICCIDSSKYFDFGMQALASDPWLSAKGPAADSLELERVRVGGNVRAVGQEAQCLDEILQKLESAPSQMMPELTDQLLDQSARQLFFTLRHHRTGDENYGWVVPERWSLKSCIIASMDGLESWDAASGQLDVLPHSRSIEIELSRSDLQGSLCSKEFQGNTAGFCQSYARNWGIRLRTKCVSEFKAEKYQVLLRSEYAKSEWITAEVEIPGQSRDSILILCRYFPLWYDVKVDSLKEVFDTIVALRKKQLHQYTYRFVLVPDWAGTAAYLRSIQSTTWVGVISNLCGLHIDGWRAAKHIEKRAAIDSKAVEHIRRFTQTLGEIKEECDIWQNMSSANGAGIASINANSLSELPFDRKMKLDDIISAMNA